MAFRLDIFKLCLSLWGSTLSIVAVGSEPLQVTASSPATKYVVGVPVVLHVTVANETNEPFPVLIETLKQQIEIEIARQGQAPQRFHPPLGIVPIVESPTVRLNAKESKTYSFRILYGTFGGDMPYVLAFPDAMVYEVHAKYPWKGKLSSNTVKIQVTEPTGKDAVVWKSLSKPSFLFFLQNEYPRRGDQDVPADLCALLTSAARDSSYRPAIEYALSTYYNRRCQILSRGREERDPELATIRSALGVDETFTDPFPDARPLDRLVTYHFPNPTPLSDVTAFLSAQGGFSIVVDEALANRQFQSKLKTRRIRDFMRTLAGKDAHWIAGENRTCRLESK